MPSWPGATPDDATRRLAHAHRDRRPVAPVTDRHTACDRCGVALGDHIHVLTLHELGGTPATWFVCRACDRALVWWMALGGPAGGLGGT